MNIQFVSCHRKAERSFFWRGKQFPVCARCTGIYLGYLSFPVFNFDLYYISSLFSILLIMPTLLDGLTQAYMRRESTNFIRLTTGILGGVGAMSLIINIGTFIGNLILK
ncbi:hypothetical protein BWI96_06800 [Siphonobacter sp. SORGH_AS_0500]|uniref:DUF2085 domain-containing protein n=1 Tax=Siphonobacter sp. SORGH_AS_0500 TaxID=1864824 RepID=UPI000CB50F14|nr:hypothetical protein BWI96_06800 [Siphonobacter sp. SORGH_AS_0500]